MIASCYTLHDDGRDMAWIAPTPLIEQPDRLKAQGRQALRVLRGLNLATCGEPVGPFKQLTVFNAPEDES